MRKILTVLLISLFIVTAGTVHAAEQQDQDAAFQSFQPIVKKVSDFFAKNPKLLAKVAPAEDPRAKAYFTTHFMLRRSYYDILKTNSIVTPFSGFIDITTDVLDNKNCGTASFNKKDKDGWSTVEDALKNIENKTCYVSRTSGIGPITTRFNFQYQARDKKWIFTNIIRQDGKLDGRFMALMGMASPGFPLIDEPQAQAQNKAWTDLLKSL